jgi:enoyl-CoA hydratase/carnithine racemase
MADKLASDPPASSSYILSYPAPHVLLVTINRPKAMNSIPMEAHWEADAIFDWFDSEPELRVAIVTGAGQKAFCAGQDLIEQKKFKSGEQPPRYLSKHPPGGFMGVSRRGGKKPIVAAVNGFALGGGFEIVLNW